MFWNTSNDIAYLADVDIGGESYTFSSNTPSMSLVVGLYSADYCPVNSPGGCYP